MDSVGEQITLRPMRGTGPLISKHRIGREQAMVFIGTIRERLTRIDLSSEEYANLLDSSANRVTVRRTIYDAMPAHCALKCGAEAIYTWKERHYALCGPEGHPALTRTVISVLFTSRPCM